MQRIDNILVPIDFSEISGRILQLALFMAKKFNAELRIVFVAEDIFTYSGFTMADLPITTQFDTDTFHSSQKRLKSFLEKEIPDTSISYQREVLQGRPAEQIVEYSSSHNIDLIIMGTHGYRGLERMFMGSVTERVLKLAPCPVLATR